MNFSPGDRPSLPPRQDEDGNVYLAYFVPEQQAAFCWSGDPEQPVEVAYGGMGEPVVETFRMPARLLDLAGYLAEFKRQCDKHLAEQNVRGCSCGMADYGAPGHDGDPNGTDHGQED